MVFKLAEAAQKKWQRLRGYKLLAEVVKGVKFKDGIRVSEDNQQMTEKTLVHQI